MGNFSRDTFSKVNQYVGVRLQQGVPIVDADWNEMEDIRKYELEAFLKWFIGNGVPKGNDGFRILPAGPTGDGALDDFVIKGGDGTPEKVGRCLVEGWDVINPKNLNYKNQDLFIKAGLPAKWGVPALLPLTTPTTANRTDTVYLDVWEREVNAQEVSGLINDNIGIETCVRRKREWVVRVAEGTSSVPAPTEGHVFYLLASISRKAGQPIRTGDISDRRQTGLHMADLQAEIVDARGIKASIGNRLDECLTKGGQLRLNSVGAEQIQDNSVQTSKLADGAISNSKIANGAVSGENVADTSLSYSKLAGQLQVTDVPVPAGTSKEYVIGIPDPFQMVSVSIQNTNYSEHNLTWHFRNGYGTWIIPGGIGQIPKISYYPAKYIVLNNQGTTDVTVRVRVYTLTDPK